MVDTWTNASGGNYADPSNWSYDVPNYGGGTGDAVLPDLEMPYTVVVDTNSLPSLDSLTTAYNVTLEVAADFDVQGGYAVVSTINDGTFIVSGAGNAYLQTSYVYNDGFIQLDSGTAASWSVLSIESHIAFVNYGTVDLNGPYASLNINGVQWGGAIDNEGMIEATGGEAGYDGLVITGNVTNNGTIAVSGAGSQITIENEDNITTSVSGAGELLIGDGGTLLILGSSVSCNVVFGAGGGGLVLDEYGNGNPGLFTGTISGLAVGDVIDFGNKGITGYALNGGTLTVDSSNGGPYTYTLATPLPAGDTFSVENGSELVVAGPAPVADTAANISANLDTYETNLPPSITVTDNNPLSVTVGQITSYAAALAVTSNANGSAYALDVVDTAANVSAGLDTLNGDSHVASITLTDGGTPALSLTVAQALKDMTALGEIVSPHTITVSDTGANVSALTPSQIAALAAEGVTSIVVTDGVVDLDLSAAQAVAIESAGLHISNPNSPAYYPVIVLDYQSDIQALTPTQIAGLASDGIGVIESFEALVWNVAQTDALITSGMSSGSYTSVALEDTAANIETLTPAQIDAGRNQDAIISFTATDASLTFDVAQAIEIEQNGILVAAPAGDSVALADTAAKLSTLTASDLAALRADGFTAFAVVDTAADISADLNGLEVNLPSSITISDNNPLTVTVGQITSDAAALAVTSNSNGSPYQLAVIDTEADITAGLNGLNGSDIASITISDNTPIGVTVAQLTSDAAAIGKLANENETPYQLAVTDTAENVSAGLDTLNGDSQVALIALTGGGTPALNLTVAQALNDTAALGEIVSPHTITVSDTGADVSALTASQIAALATEGVTSIVISDGVVEHAPFGLELSAARAVALAAGGIHIWNPNSSAYYPVIVLDSQANVQALTPAQIEALGSDGVSDIAAFGALVWTVAQTDALISGGLSSGTFGAGAVPVVIVDIAANIETLTPAQINAARNLEGVVQMSATNGSLTFDVAQALQIEQSGITVAVPASDSVTVADSAANIAALTAAQIAGLAAEGITTLTVSDTAAHVAANLDALQTLAAAGELSSIALTEGGTPTLTITASQLTNDATALGDITSGYQLAVTGVAAASAATVAVTAHVVSVAVSDTAAHAATNLDALQPLAAAGELSSIALTDGGTPTLTLTIEEALSDTAALSKIVSPHTLALADTATHIAAISSAQAATLKAAGFTSVASTTGPVTVTVAEAQLLTGEGIAVTGGAAATDPIAAMLALTTGVASSLVTAGYSLAVVDTAANIRKLTSHNIASLQASHVTLIEASDTSVGLPVALATLLEAAPAIQVVALNGSVTVTDTSSNLGMTPASVIAGLPSIGIASLVSSNGSVMIKAQQAAALETTGLKITGPGGANVTVTLTDLAANIFGASGLSLTQLAQLPSAGASAIKITDASVTLSVAQATALESAKLKVSVPTGDKVTLSDTPLNIMGLTGGATGTIAALPATGVSAVAASGNVTLSVAQATAFETAKLAITLPVGDYATLSDSAANLKTLTAAQIAGLSGLDVLKLNANDVTAVPVTLSVAQAEALLTANIALTVQSGAPAIVYDTASNLETMLTNLSATQLSNLRTDIGFTALEASNSVSYTAAQTTALLNVGFNISEVGATTATENFSNGNYLIYQYNELVQQKSVNADRTYDIAYYSVTGKPYSSYEDLYNTGGKVAEVQDVSSGLGNVILYANALTVSQASGSENITTGTDTFAVTPHATETTTATGRSNETFVFASGFGTDTLVGFLATSANHDLVELSTSMFAAGSTVTSILNGATGTSSPTITDLAGDTLTFSGVNKSTLLANTGDFKLV
jgi:hypothetical protein